MLWALSFLTIHHTCPDLKLYNIIRDLKVRLILHITNPARCKSKREYKWCPAVIGLIEPNLSILDKICVPHDRA
jgi:hypothetical protein